MTDHASPGTEPQSAPTGPAPMVFRPDDPAVSRPPAADPSAVPVATAPRETAVPSRGWLGPLVLAVGSGLALLALAIAYDVALLIQALMAVQPLLGWAAAGLAAALVLGLGLLLGREVATLRRLRSIEDVRRLAERAAGSADRAAVDQSLAALDRLYARRRDLAWATARYRERRDEAVDPADRLIAFEAELMRPLDRQAVQAIARTAQMTAVFTAISPFTAVDILVTAWRNFALVRQLATLYGGRPGLAGTTTLVRRIFVHMALTGGMDAGDGLAAEMLGGGMAAKVSARLGQGLVNGLLTARVGIAAIDFCRPLPFLRAPKPTVRELATTIGDGLRQRL